MAAKELKRRVEELEASPGRKAAFEARLRRMPKPKDPLEEALGEAVGELLEALLGCNPVF
jgi:hypothetical protein